MAAPFGRKTLGILKGMNALLSKLAVLGVVAGGFYATGDLPRLIERGRRIAERSTVPLPDAGSPDTVAAAPDPPLREPPPAHDPPPAPRFEPPPPAVAHTPPAPPIPSKPEPAAPPADPARDEPTRIPMPPLALETIDLASLQPGQRVLLLCGRHVIALDVVDGPAGEVLEHAHAWHPARTVTIAATAAPRRLVVIGCSAGSGRLKPGSAQLKPGGDRQIARGDWLHAIPSGSNSSGANSSGGISAAGRSTPAGRAMSAGEAFGPIEAIGLE